MQVESGVRMRGLVPVHGVEVQVLVDNATDGLSTVSSHSESEFSYLARRGMRELAGEHLCCACHGLSYLITAHRGAVRHTVLFDSGPEGDAFQRNTQALAVDLGTIESIVLSHGHWDHAGGMIKALDLIQERNGGRPVLYYAHPGMFRSRARRLASGRMLPSKDVPGVDTLTAHGARVINTVDPQIFLDGMFCLSGEIPRVTPFEQGLAEHYQRTSDGQDWEPDPWIMDERCLIVNVERKGLVVFTACSHAGVINVLTHVRECYPKIPIYAVMGGFHLAGPNQPLIPATIEAMKTFDIQLIAAGHCTGWRALAGLFSTFGDAIVDPSVVGKCFTL